MSDLHEAAALGSVDQLQQALRRGADVNLPDQYLMNKCVRKCDVCLHAILIELGFMFEMW